MSETIGYDVVISQEALEKIISYKNSILAKTVTPGEYLKKALQDSIKSDVSSSSREQVSTEQFIEALLSTKKPKIFASAVKCDGKDWTRSELHILGDINIAMPVEIYDNGVWAKSDSNFKQHVPPFQGQLLFTPGPLLRSRARAMSITPDAEEIITNGVVNQEKYNQMFDRRLTPLLYHANESAKKEDVSALITLPGIGCGVFAGKFKGKMGKHLNEALQHIVAKHAKNFTNISCIYYDPYDECSNEEKTFNGIKYRVRPRKQHPTKSQLLQPVNYQESGDNFSKSKLFKVVAWDHVSFPGNNYFVGSRRTDDGVVAAATNSMQVITGVKGRYNSGGYLPPVGKTNWRQVVEENKIILRAKGNVKVVTNNGKYVDLVEFERNVPKAGNLEQKSSPTNKRFKSS